MEEIPPREHAHALAEQDLGEKSCQFKGIRKRKWGSWVSEIRMPRSRQKLWLGSYATAEQAARAYDAAVYCLRGPDAKLNFPDSIPCIPSASSLSRHQIQLAAARHATMDQLPSSAPKDIDNYNKAPEDSPSPSRSASVQHQQEHESALWESLFAGSDDCLTQNLESLPLIDEASASNLIPSPSWEEQHHEQQEEENNVLHLTDLWNFER